MAIPFLSPTREHTLITPLLYGLIASITFAGLTYFILPIPQPLDQRFKISYGIILIFLFLMVFIGKSILISADADRMNRIAARKERYEAFVNSYTLESHAVYDEHHRLYETGQPLPEANILRATLMPNGDLMHVFSVKSPSGENLRGMTVWKRNTPLA